MVPVQEVHNPESERRCLWQDVKNECRCFHRPSRRGFDADLPVAANFQYAVSWALHLRRELCQVDTPGMALLLILMF